MIDLSIIIVTWNSREDLIACLPSLPDGCGDLRTEVLIVDNASDDDSVAFARTLLPSAQVITNSLNEGFARANNRAMRTAAGRYLCLLNPDTRVRPGALARLVAFLDDQPDAGACGPGILNADGTPQKTGVRFPSLWNMTVEAFFLDRLFPRTRLFGAHRELYETGMAPRPVDFVQGSCLVVRREVVERIGGLDERFFMYFEETDWCRRMAADGRKVYLVPEAAVVHFGGGTTGHYDERRLVFYHESLFRYFGKHRSGPAGCLARLVVGVRSAIRVLVWLGTSLVRPELRHAGLSAVRGYLRVCAMTVRPAGGR